jgi:hypothetical protein
VAGGVGGDLARKGQQPRWVLVALRTTSLVGILSVVVGVVAFAMRQPFPIWG